jgi:hypothetical protein
MRTIWQPWLAFEPGDFSCVICQRLLQQFNFSPIVSPFERPLTLRRFIKSSCGATAGATKLATVLHRYQG